MGITSTGGNTVDPRTKTNPYGATPPRVLIVAPYDDDFLHPCLPA